jgi:hypothetical protein
MCSDHFTALRHRLASASSRRGLLGGLAAGLLMADPVGAAAKRKVKRKKRNKKKDRIRTRADALCAESTGSSVALPSPDARVAQTFTAIRSGTLVRVEVEISNSAGTVGDYFLQVAPVDAFGVPTNEVLADAAVASEAVPDGISRVDFPFPQPPKVVAGDRYAVVLSRPEVGPQWSGRSGDGCPGGRAFVSDDLTAPFRSLSLSFDFIFTTFVRS